MAHHTETQTGTPVRFITTDTELDELAVVLRSAELVALDTETHSWADQPDAVGILRAISLAWDFEGRRYAAVLDVAGLTPARLAGTLSGLEVCGWNATFDDTVLAKALGPLRLRWWDAMLADVVCHQGRAGFEFYRGLAEVAAERCGLVLEGKGTTQVSFDATTPLSAEQVAYAALDAIATLAVARHIRDELAVDRTADGGASWGLAEADRLEQRARPFLAAMTRHGLWLDWTGWTSELAALQTRCDEALAQLASLTGGGQFDIFTMAEHPTWNPDSGPQVREAFNVFDTDRVRTYLERTSGSSRLLGATDKVDKDMLRDIGGELAAALLDYRDAKKVLSTYGENLTEFIGTDGRIHPEYIQVVGTGTGRLASRRPNAQNLTPRLKPYFRPQDPERVFVYADLSQAELRKLAQVSGDEAMRSAFISGTDVHSATAERMFGVDMAALAASDPAEYKKLRSQAKTLNFSVVYGTGPAALGRSLTLSGVPTTTEEARGLLRSYFAAYPGVKAWLDARAGVVAALADRPPAVDLVATLRLAADLPRVRAAVRAYRKAHSEAPGDDALLEAVSPDSALRSDLESALGRAPFDEELATARDARRAELAWVRGHRAAVVIGAHGAPVGFTSYTDSGRQRRFEIVTDGFLLSMATIAAQSAKPEPSRLRDAFAAERGVELSRAGKALSRDELAKVFEDRGLRRAFVDFVCASMGDAAAGYLARKALSDRIRAMGNAYKNAAIQGGVADIVTDAYGRLWDVLEHRPSVWPVQTVHDSIVLECDAHEAPELVALLKSSLEDAMAAACPDVPAVADADIRTSLDDNDVLEVLAAA